MIELLTNQREADRAYRRWVKAMIGGSTEEDGSWIINGTGVIFSNYGHGAPGTVEDQIMLGVDTSAGNGVVKIVRPIVSGQDKKKLTVVGRDERGHVLLLREGWLKKNRMSNAVRERFSELSGLQPVPVSVAGEPSNREWHIVADVNGSGVEIVAETVAFCHACALARWKAGGPEGGDAVKAEQYHLGLDEKGRIKKVCIEGGTKEVEELQGYVSEALKAIIGPTMTKPSRNRYEVDAMIEAANLLIEIKTGTSPHDVYEAVGQLTLYPSLISLPTASTRSFSCRTCPRCAHTWRPRWRRPRSRCIPTLSVGSERRPRLPSLRHFLSAAGASKRAGRRFGLSRRCEGVRAGASSAPDVAISASSCGQPIRSNRLRPLPDHRNLARRAGEQIGCTIKEGESDAVGR